jgi:small subunit ribosomal protein S21
MVHAAEGLSVIFASLTVMGAPLVQIIVRDNNVDQALKALKKKMQREGTFREMKRRNHFEKPSEKRAREDAEAVRRTRKLQRKRAQREGIVGRM